ncbi:AMP-binding protein [Tomitella gaofuii]|uniref:AMP-binding protein n=1 Tax=Tomitella gaofuii TaxID=2760083 RepID=UPI0020BE05B1|nr:AMP-binding protein [Tomitella gaofuii]
MEHPPTHPYGPAHQRSLGAMLQHWATELPDSPGIAVEGVCSRTFAQWLRRSSALAAGFRELIGPDTDAPAPQPVFGFVGRNTVLWGEVMTAASLIRACAVPLNWRLSRREAAEIVDDSGVHAIVAEADFLPLLGHPAPVDGRPRLVVPGEDPYDYERWLAGLTPLHTFPEPDPEDIALMIYTSGTSGRPKGVELSNRAISVNLAAPQPWDIVPGDVVMIPAPNFHLSGTGWVFYCLAVGAGSHHVLDIDPGRVLETFASGAVDHALTVPAVVQALVQHPSARERAYPGLRTLIYGGSPMSPTIVADAQEVFDCDLVQSYGMTETCGPITFLDAADHRRGGLRLGSAGRATPVVRMGVFDPVTGEELPTGGVGEVWTRSRMLLSGYRNRPGELAAVLRPDGWFRTGDIGYLDADGYLFLCDRAKDMIVSGGENIYPVEVENVLMEHSAINDVAVIGVPDDRWGETVKAVAVRTGDTPIAADDLIAFCRDRLAHYKCPTSVDFLDALPRNPSGKVLKRELRRPYWEGAARAIG